MIPEFDSNAMFHALIRLSFVLASISMLGVYWLLFILV